MKHAGPGALDRLAPLLVKLRHNAALREKSRGCFYLGGRSFLHFHEHGDEIYADLKEGSDFTRLPAGTAAQQRQVLLRAAAVLGDGKRRPRR
ncbi:MAG: hypothetical protein JSR60_01300 [Proteobacteria bacterium]|nr:hypothetical protein [Pseudomonadota bacterium]